MGANDVFLNEASNVINNKPSLLIKIFKKMVIPFSILILVNIVFAALYLIICNNKDDWNGMDDEEDTVVMKLFKRIYFSMTTTSTVGYGDISPKSVKARVLVMFHYAIIVLELLSTFI